MNTVNVYEILRNINEKTGRSEDLAYLINNNVKDTTEYIVLFALILKETPDLRRLMRDSLNVLTQSPEPVITFRTNN